MLMMGRIGTKGRREEKRKLEVNEERKVNVGGREREKKKRVKMMVKMMTRRFE